MFNILHTESSTGWGGQESRTLHESIGLRKLGARIVILCQPGSVIGEKAGTAGFDVRRCRMKKSYDVFAINKIQSLIKSENIDIVSTHSGRDSFLAGIAGRLSVKRPAVVRTRHLALPITSTFTYNVLAHRIVTVSEYVREYLISARVSPAKISVVHTCVDLRKFDPANAVDNLRDELGLEEDTPLVGTVSVLRIKKGHHVLLDAVPLILQKVPKAVFVFAGNGPQKKNIKNKISSLGLNNNVYMLGLRNNVQDILKSIDIFVLPTLEEALGTSYLEAMAMGKPVIGSCVGGVPEVISDGVNGYLTKPNDPVSLSNAVVNLLQDSKISAKMGMQGRKIVQDNYSVEKMSREMFGLYSSLLKGRKK